MDYEQIVSLVREVSKAGLSHFEYSEGNIHISMGCKSEENISAEVQANVSVPAANVSVQGANTPVPAANESSPVVTTSTSVPAANTSAQGENAFAQTTDNTEDISVHSNIQVVTSPLVGTFYSAPSENAESFVKVGDRVEKGQTLAIVEAMKLMNEIESDYAGIVTEILVENESPVEYGQPLFKIAQ